MTKTQALAEARRRWDGDAAVQDDGAGAGELRFLVGTYNWPRVRGMGATWEAAFADADAGTDTERKRP